MLLLRKYICAFEMLSHFCVQNASPLHASLVETARILGSCVDRVSLYALSRATIHLACEAN